MSNPLAVRIAGLHGFLVKLGPRFGGGFVKLIAYYALYKVFTAGGVEALAYICYEHLLRQGEAEKVERKKRGT